MDDSDSRLDGLPDDFSPAVRRAFANSVVSAYSDNGTYFYDPEVGHNAMTLGQQINASIRKYLPNELQRLEGVGYQLRPNTIDVFVGELITARPAKLGYSSADDIWSSFPRSQATVRRMALNNLHYTPAFEDPDFPGPRHFFIGHFGDQDGCQAIYLCAPDIKRATGRFGWQLCVPIYLADEVMDTLESGNSTPGPDPEIIDDDLNLNLRDNEGEEEGEDNE